MTFNCSHNPISSVKLILSARENTYLFVPCVVKTKRFFMLLCFKSVWSGCNKFPSKTLISAFLLKIVFLIAEKEIMATKHYWNEYRRERDHWDKDRLLCSIFIDICIKGLEVSCEQMNDDFFCRIQRNEKRHRWSYRLSNRSLSNFDDLHFNYVTSGNEGVHNIYLVPNITRTPTPTPARYHLLTMQGANHFSWLPCH